ncbi:MAG: hypothetical protein A2X56_00390 [Nitrospirae bacterium GWC2_57_13]|nr:MAG: hypothetical protein A2X56_00390 [Nitrospirae bacterium GWC2_57_13]
MPDLSEHEWLLIFYSVPSRPVANRMKLWRKMARAGALQFKGAVYALPATEEHYELFQWLIAEVASMGGDGAFVKASRIETMKNSEIIALFNEARETDFRGLEKKLDPLERKIQSVRKGTSTQNIKKLAEQTIKLTKEYDAVRAIDFFSSKTGGGIGKRIHALDAELRKIARPAMAGSAQEPSLRKPEDYQNRTWVTRKNPFVDRMASAWLIRRFIDPGARFGFIDEQEAAQPRDRAVSFDIRGGEFTHQGDLCTCEVLLRSFSVRDSAAARIAEIVHDLDIRDEKYGTVEAAGVEEMLAGIRKTAGNDNEALERGMSVFEMLYAAKQ